MTSLPKWEDLPSLDLYLDQVLLYINQETAPFLSHNDKPLTAAMINNYVKHGYIPKPTKKKYSRQQIARLIVLSVCKSVFSIADITQMIDIHYKDADSKELYDTFVVSLAGSHAQSDTPDLISKACQTIQSYREAMLLVEALKEEH